MNTCNNADDKDDVVMGTAEEECTVGDGMVARTIPCEQKIVVIRMQPPSHNTDRNTCTDRNAD
eukprot:CAMPEP_0172403818 /NCGR_PEP_ID=MMETSP1061-20121228/60644_1 /TAXON_ID=37318 /ORGANISM="Pseudo-nitzschia pungens, Strain cf. pungens" /LENGTH=62 /DNA_ID=CAMNT_0013138353 /DNA_START=55 /DNA_END=240 /DNA_ORIENTATION=-